MDSERAADVCINLWCFIDLSKDWCQIHGLLRIALVSQKPILTIPPYETTKISEKETLAIMLWGSRWVLGGNVKHEASWSHGTSGLSTLKNLQLIPELLMKFWYPGSLGGKNPKTESRKTCFSYDNEFFSRFQGTKSPPFALGIVRETPICIYLLGSEKARNSSWTFCPQKNDSWYL